jgi:hypothetical protein
MRCLLARSKSAINSNQDFSLCRTHALLIGGYSGTDFRFRYLRNRLYRQGFMTKKIQQIPILNYKTVGYLALWITVV